jgi:hypothetical protein
VEQALAQRKAESLVRHIELQQRKAYQDLLEKQASLEQAVQALREQTAKRDALRQELEKVTQHVKERELELQEAIKRKQQGDLEPRREADVEAEKSGAEPKQPDARPAEPKPTDGAGPTGAARSAAALLAASDAMALAKEAWKQAYDKYQDSPRVEATDEAMARERYFQAKTQAQQALGDLTSELRLKAAAQQ